MTRHLRMPPRIKVLEAAGALGDGRVRGTRSLSGGARLTVTGSDGRRRYTVIIEPGGPGEYRVYSDDNGTRLRGYIGYPIIAGLMLLGALPRDTRIERALTGIPWRRLNEELKRYSLVIERVKRVAAERGVSPGMLEEYMDKVVERLRSLRITYDPGLAPG